MNNFEVSQPALLGISISGFAVSAFVFTLKSIAYSKWVRAEGKVTKLNSVGDTDENGSTLWEACIEFETQNCKRVEFTNEVKSNPPVARVGGKVPVLYRPDDSSVAIVDKFVHRHLFELVVFGFGVICLVIYLAR